MPIFEAEMPQIDMDMTPYNDEEASDRILDNPDMNRKPATGEHLFTVEEAEALRLITAFWNLFTTLPSYHPRDIHEVIVHVHALQEKLMVRPTQRALGWIRLPDGSMTWCHPEEQYKKSTKRWERKKRG